MAMTDEQRFESNERRRCRADDAAYDRLCRKMDEAEALIGQFVHGEFYINVRTKAGAFTGRIRRFDQRGEAVDYLIRNRYV